VRGLIVRLQDAPPHAPAADGSDASAPPGQPSAQPTSVCALASAATGLGAEPGCVSSRSAGTRFASSSTVRNSAARVAHWVQALAHLPQ
jgi:hypothetical protein